MDENVKDVKTTVVKGIGIVREYGVLDVEGLFKRILEIHNRDGAKTK